MPTLKDLQNPLIRKEFTENVAKGAIEPEKNTESNEGIKNAKEYMERLQKGDQIQFDYERLLKESIF